MTPTITINAVDDNDNSPRPFLACQVAKNRIDTLADTGAFMSVIDLNFLRDIATIHPDKVRRIPAPLINARSATGHQFTTHGVYEVPIHLLSPDVEISWPFLVVGELQARMILGSDFLHRTDAVIESGEKRVHWPRGFKLPKMSSRASLRTRTSVYVAAMSSVRVKLRVTGGQIEQTGICSPRNEEFIEAISQIDKNGNCDAVFFNPSHEEVSFSKGTDVGTFLPWAIEDLISLDAVCPKKEAHRTPLPAAKEKFLQQTFLALPLPPAVKNALWQIVLRNHDAFSAGPFDLGHNTEMPMSVNMRNDEPVHVKQFPIPWAHRGYLDGYVDELLKKGCIEASKSPYNSPVFGVPKKDGTIRMVCDYRRINDASLPDKHVIKEVQDCIDTVGSRGSTVFSTLDLTSGFWQQELEPNSRAVTAFTIPGRGRFQWRRVPMGLSGSPAAFSRLIEEVTRELEGVQGYLDDVLVHSPTVEAHLADLERCLERLIQHNLKLNLKKCQFLAEEVPYLGFTLSAAGVKPGRLKLQAVEEFPEPQTPRQIRQFTGLANYFRHMIPHFSLLSGKLTALLCKDNAWKHGPLPIDARKAFKELQRQLTREPILGFPSPARRFFLSTDAAAGDAENPGGLGAMLTQRDEKNVERAIAYASRTLRPNEKNYSAYLLELAAICWAVEHFHVYLYGNEFTVITDHRPLETLKTVHKKTLNRLQEKLLNYQITLVYRPGRDNGPADALSRNAMPIDAVQMETRIRKLQKEDFECRQLSSAGRPEIVQLNGLLVRGYTDPTRGQQFRIIAPKLARAGILEASHASLLTGHQGAKKTLQQVLSAYWWPGVTTDVESHVAHCVTCQEVKNPPRFNQQHAPHKPLPIPDRPNDRVHVDLFGPLKGGTDGQKYVMVMTDAFSKYVELAAIPNKEAETVALAILTRWIRAHSCPLEILTDRGREFNNKIMDDLYKRLHVKRSMTAAMHPQCNASAEVVNKTIIKYMQAMLTDASADWVELLPAVQMAYNARMHETTLHTPHFLMHGRDARLPDFADSPKVYGEDWVTDRWRNLQRAFQAVKTNSEDRASRNKRTTDQTAVVKTFQPGQEVLVFFPKSTANRQENSKFTRPWRHFLVRSQVSDATYALSPKEHPKRTTVVHADRIKELREKDGTLTTCGPPVDSGSSHTVPRGFYLPSDPARGDQRPSHCNSTQQHTAAAAADVAGDEEDGDEGEEEDDDGGHAVGSDAGSEGGGGEEPPAAAHAATGSGGGSAGGSERGCEGGGGDNSATGSGRGGSESDSGSDGETETDALAAGQADAAAAPLSARGGRRGRPPDATVHQAPATDQAVQPGAAEGPAGPARLEHGGAVGGRRPVHPTAAARPPALGRGLASRGGTSGGRVPGGVGTAAEEQRQQPQQARETPQQARTRTLAERVGHRAFGKERRGRSAGPAEDLPRVQARTLEWKRRGSGKPKEPPPAT